MRNEGEARKIYCRGCGETMTVKAGDQVPERCDLCGEPLSLDQPSLPPPGAGAPPTERSA